MAKSANGTDAKKAENNNAGLLQLPTDVFGLARSRLSNLSSKFKTPSENGKQQQHKQRISAFNYFQRSKKSPEISANHVKIPKSHKDKYQRQVSIDIGSSKLSVNSFRRQNSIDVCQEFSRSLPGTSSEGNTLKNSRLKRADSEEVRKPTIENLCLLPTLVLPLQKNPIETTRAPPTPDSNEKPRKKLSFREPEVVGSKKYESSAQTDKNDDDIFVLDDDESILESQALRIVRSVGQAFDVCKDITPETPIEQEQEADLIQNNNNQHQDTYNKKLSPKKLIHIIPTTTIEPAPVVNGETAPEPEQDACPFGRMCEAEANFIQEDCWKSNKDSNCIIPAPEIPFENDFGDFLDNIGLNTSTPQFQKKWDNSEKDILDLQKILNRLAEKETQIQSLEKSVDFYQRNIVKLYDAFWTTIEFKEMFQLLLENFKKDPEYSIEWSMLLNSYQKLNKCLEYLTLCIPPIAINSWRQENMMKRFMTDINQDQVAPKSGECSTFITPVVESAKLPFEEARMSILSVPSTSSKSKSAQYNRLNPPGKGSARITTSIGGTSDIIPASLGLLSPQRNRSASEHNNLKIVSPHKHIWNRHTTN